MEQSVYGIVEQGSIGTVYQPIVDHTNDAVFAYEALSRPLYEGKSIPPEIWFHTAQERDLAAHADLLAVSSAVRNFRLPPPEIISTPLFVNVMPSSIADESFRNGLVLLFEEGCCRPEQLILELVEYVSYNASSLTKLLEPIRSLGVRIALDDVGTGSTNLSALIELEPDFIKIDRSLIQDIATSSSKRRLLTHLAGFMESGSSVIAEGVENHDDLLAVRETGVNLSQGFYWAPPMPADDMPFLTIQIEIERKALIKIANESGGVLTNEAVVQKSQELDLLINQYSRIKNGM
ncbi:MAG: EAL domain-containing protein [Alicyclobacillus sp.]|nr:EAL domain-containing protein [Alicyclobacillus sp.]